MRFYQARILLNIPTVNDVLYYKEMQSGASSWLQRI